MKNIFFYLLVVNLLVSKYSFSQCLLNGNFDASCGTNSLGITGCGGYFDQTCIPNWRRSHGTPHLNYYASNPSLNDIYMFSKNNEEVPPGGVFQSGIFGEGIVGGYSFTAGVQYKISVQYYLADDGSSTIRNRSGFDIRATTGLTAPNVIASPNPYNPCGEFVPTPASDLIGSFYLPWSPGWKTATFLYKPSVSNSQVWIYPFSEQGTGISEITELNLDYITICPDVLCNTSIVYQNDFNNNGTTTESSPALPAPRSNGVYTTIKAGGSIPPIGEMDGIVPVEPGLVTNFFASQQIELTGSFDALVNANGMFNAEIVLCSSGDSRPMNNGSQGIEQIKRTNLPPKNGNKGIEKKRNHLMPVISKNSFKIYPNPARDLANIQLSHFNDGDFIIEIHDLNGRLVLKSTSLKGIYSNQIPVKVNTLKNGMYFVTVKSKRFSATSKLTINK